MIGTNQRVKFKVAKGRKGWRTEKVWGSQPRVCRCGAYGTVLHHKDRNPDNETIDNIEPLCRPCHASEHLEDRRKSESSRRDHITKSWVKRSGRTIEEASKAISSVFNLHDQGFSTRRIAVSTGLSKSYVHHLIKKKENNERYEPKGEA